MTPSPETVAPGVYRLDVIALPNAISVFLLEEDQEWTLVDAGVNGSSGRIREGLSELGGRPEELRRIYITHHHPDHIGGLSGVREWAPQAELVASEREALIISGRLTPEEPSGTIVRLLAKWLPKPPVVPVDTVAREGEKFAGFRVIATPGHSLGHTSLLSERHGVLLTGDAFGRLPSKVRVGVRKFLCADPARAKRSAEKLLTEEFSTLVFSHGKTVSEDAHRILGEATSRCEWV